MDNLREFGLLVLFEGYDGIRLPSLSPAIKRLETAIEKSHSERGSCGVTAAYFRSLREKTFSLNVGYLKAGRSGRDRVLDIDCATGFVTMVD